MELKEELKITKIETELLMSVLDSIDWNGKVIKTKGAFEAVVYMQQQHQLRCESPQCLSPQTSLVLINILI